MSPSVLVPSNRSSQNSMSNVIIDPEVLSQEITLSSDLDLRYFISKPLKDVKQTLVFHVGENVSLNLLMVDFAYMNCHLDVKVDLKRGAKATLSLASLNSHEYEKIFNLDVTHQEVDSFSRVKMSGINAGKGVLKFLGNSIIVNGAHRSDTRQEGRITNLHPEAKSTASPALLIKENDVVASHGAALGAYNPDQIYYLMSRGLSMQQAKKLITFGTLLPIIEQLSDEDLINKAKTVLEDLSI